MKLADIYCDLFVGCAPEMAFVIGVAFGVGLIVDALVVLKALEFLLDIARVFVRKIYRYLCNRIHARKADAAE